MTARKRKATQELTRNFVEAEPIQGPDFIAMALELFSSLKNWWCYPTAQPAQPPTHPDINYGSLDVVTNQHRQSIEPRADGAMAVKRQRNNYHNGPSRRSPSQPRRNPPTATEQPRHRSAKELEDEYNEIFSPPEFGAPPKPFYSEPPTPPPPSREPIEIIEISDDEDENEGDKPQKSTPIPDSPQSTPSPRSPISATMRFQRSLPSQIRPGFIRETQDSRPIDELLFEHLAIKDAPDGKDGRSPFDISTHARNKFEANAKERQRKERAEAARLARERRLTRQYPSKPLVQVLECVWEDKISKMIENARRATHTPLTQSQGGTPLHLKDFQTLLVQNAWLNDEIINTYIEWIVDAANAAAAKEAKMLGEPISTVPKFLAHNSFFYENLDKKGPNSTERLMKRKKVPGASLLEVDTVFVPICRGSHWTIGVVRPLARTIEYFDSLQGSPQTFIRLMRGWLKFQLGSKYKEEEWKTPATGCTRQMNGYDCGVFVCTNALCVALGLDTRCYNGSDMTPMRRNIAALLINKGFKGDFAWGQGLF